MSCRMSVCLLISIFTDFEKLHKPVTKFQCLKTGFKPDENQIRDHQAELEGAYNELLQLAAARRARLDESHKLQTFYRDAEEEEMWVSEKAHSLQSTDYGHDLNSAMVLLNKHEVCNTF